MKAIDLIDEIAYAQTLNRVCYSFLIEWKHEYLDMPIPIDTGLLYHYTTLKTCSLILKSDDIFLFDSRSCNDIEEYEHGRQIVQSNFADVFSNPIFTKGDFPEQDDSWCRYEYHMRSAKLLLQKIQQRYYDLNAQWLCYVFCVSGPRFPPASNPDDLFPQDNLSMWRGYAADGDGACLLFLEYELKERITHTKGLTILPVIYDDGLKYFFCKMLFRLIYTMMP